MRAGAGRIDPMIAGCAGADARTTAGREASATRCGVRRSKFPVAHAAVVPFPMEKEWGLPCVSLSEFWRLRL